MAEDEVEASPMSVKDRIAQLKLNQVGRSPGQVPSKDPPANTNSSTGRPRPPPPPRPELPSRPSAHNRTQSSNVPPVQSHGTVSNVGVNNQPARSPPNANGMDGIARPALPPRTSTQSSALTPALPPRRPSETPSQSEYQTSRRGSNASTSSAATARSSISGMSATTGTSVGSQAYGIRAPAFDPASLPKLPARQTQEQKDAYHGKVRRPQLKTAASQPNIIPQEGTTPPPARNIVKPTVVQPGPVPVVKPVTPARPFEAAPVKPTRRPEPVQEEPAQIEPAPAVQTPIPPPRPVRNIEPPPPPRETMPKRRSALDWGMNKSTGLPPVIGLPRPGSTPVAKTNGTIPLAKTNGAAPPPVPTGSRPDLSAIQSSKPNVNGSATPGPQVSSQSLCLFCRDFRIQDGHAARFPREAVPSSDLNWLAHQLTSPFPSATDKARTIFTWLHHNVAYDTVSFFADNVQGSTPQSTFQSGLAVCEGYAALFADLCLKSGLECYVVSGASKGFGHKERKPNDPIPPYKSTHAWNAVKIDGGVWKLVDPCWGAGHLGANNSYEKAFSPVRFTQSNDEFGKDHFPGDANRQHRTDGRIISYEEYIIGDPHEVKGKTDIDIGKEGMASSSVKPRPGPILLAQQGPSVRFSFNRICPHYDPKLLGKRDLLYVLVCKNLEGKREGSPRPLQTNGSVWWLDVPVRDIGGRGQKVSVHAILTFGDDDGHGIAAEYFKRNPKHVGWSWQTVAEWTVA